MGQKIHPNGFRVSVHRKWNQTWFTPSTEWKDLFFHQQQLETFFKSFFYFNPYTKKSISKKVLLVDLKLYKYTGRQLFLFIFFYKMRTRRRRVLLTFRRKKRSVPVIRMRLKDFYKSFWLKKIVK